MLRLSLETLEHFVTSVAYTCTFTDVRRIRIRKRQHRRKCARRRKRVRKRSDIRTSPGITCMSGISANGHKTAN